MCDDESAIRDVQDQPPVNPRWTFAAAERRMTCEFCWSGHTTLTSAYVDTCHALHGLWERVHSLLDQIFLPSDTDAGRTLDPDRLQATYQRIRRRCHAAVEAYDAGGDYRAQLPRKPEMLLLRFALPPHQPNGHLTYALNMLAACHALDLFQVADREGHALAEARKTAARLQRERNTIARVYETSCEMYKVLRLNTDLWRSNKEEMDGYLHGLKKKHMGFGGGLGQDCEDYVDFGHVEDMVEETLQMMQACQHRFEGAQKKWFDAREQFRREQKVEMLTGSHEYDVDSE